MHRHPVFASILLALLTACTAAPVECADPQRLCAGACVDVSGDTAHCGACDQACAAGQACLLGSCTSVCPSGQELCGSECKSLSSDRQHCGACGSACPDGDVCSQGQCALSCQAGLTACEGRCVNLQSDRAYCGSCDTYCSAGRVCSAGSCQTSCQAGLSNCSGSCVDTRYDPAHCGSCGAACPGYAHGEAYCRSGSCQLGACATGWGSCDGDAQNGCETDLLTSDRSCGSCGNVCSGGRSCQSGACSKRVFVTSQIYDGNLGGLAGADAKCQALADAAAIGGTYKAWLAIDDGSSPATRFSKSPGQYSLVDGTLIASSWTDLTDGTLQNPIRLTERGTAPPVSSNLCGATSVWTHTDPSGAGYSGGSSLSCSGFTSTTGQSQFGRYDVSSLLWTTACTSARSCASSSPLYCFEQ